MRANSAMKTLEKLHLMIPHLEAFLKKIVCAITDFVHVIQVLCPLTSFGDSGGRELDFP